MTNLIPEVRVNKHGVPVVKHINPNVKNSSAASGSFPAPSFPAAQAAGKPIVLPSPVDRKKVPFIAIALDLNNSKGRRDVKTKLSHINETGLGIIQRMISAVPEHNQSIKSFVLETGAVLPRQDEMTNALLVLEHLLTTDRTDLDLLLSEDHLADLCPAVLGLRARDLIQSNAVTIISTEDQLAADASVAAFIAKYGESLDTQEEHHPVLDYPTVTRDNKWDHTLPIIRNQHLDTLLREHPDDHERISEFLSERGYSATDTGPVDAIRDYLNAAEDNPALRDGWL